MLGPDLDIYRFGQAPTVDPFRVASEIQGMRIQKEQADALADQRRAVAEQRRTQAAAAQQEQAEATALSQLFGSGQPVNPADIYKIVGPQRGATILKGMMDLQNAQIKSQDEFTKSAKTRLAAVEAFPEPMRGWAWDHAVQDYASKGFDVSGIAPYSPEAMAQYKRDLLTPDKRYDAEHPKPVSMSPGASLVDPTTGKVVASSPVTPSFQSKDVLIDGQRAVVNFDPHSGKYVDGSGQDVTAKVKPIPPQSPVSGMNTLYSETDPGSIAEGIRSGTMPPDISQYGRVVQGAIASNLSKSGFNLAQAQTDWKATQKHIQTMNGAQQLRLGQSINALPDLLDSVDGLASKWKANGKLPLLNKANLALAKNGAFGADAASLANQLDTQIADVVGDLGTVYMGGNSPTDHALKLAETSLKSEWDEKVIHDMVALAKKNVTIRRNSIQNTGVAGASPDNPYAQPPAAAAAAPAAGGDVMYAKDPQGNIHSAKRGTPLPQGWVEVVKPGGGR